MLLRRLALAGLLTALTAMSATAQIAGAIYTTDEGCRRVNGNVTYEARQDVFLNGGPAHKDDPGLQPDGSYYVRVIVPGLGNNTPTVLGSSGADRPLVVVNGEFANCYRLWDVVKSASSNFTEAGYDFTTNPGGEYQVEVSAVDFDSPDWSASEEKSDNFKIRVPPAAAPAIRLAINCPPADVWSGESITYVMTATNTGNVPLSNVTISGSIGGVDFGPLTTEPETLLPGESTQGVSYTAVATGTGTLTNSVSASALYNDTAVLDSSSCSVTTHVLDVSKTALTDKDRTYSWTISKSVDRNSLLLRKGQSDSVNYTVTTSSTSADSNYLLTGAITISNSSPMPATLSSVTDSLAGATVSCPTLDVPAATVNGEVVTPGTITCTYSLFSAAAPAQMSGLNVATAAISGGPSYSSAAVPFSFVDGEGVTVHVFNGHVDVADALSCPTGFTCTPSSGSWSYDLTGGTRNYGVTFTNNTFECSQQTNAPNVATLSGGGSGSASANVAISSGLCLADVLKYYDTNANGTRDGGECVIPAWNFTVTLTNGSGSTSFTVTTASNGVAAFAMPAPYGLGSTLKVCETAAAPWMPVSPGLCAPAITVTSDVLGVLSFGNVKLGAGGGRTIGYWSNKNGQAEMTAASFTLLNALNLRNANGTHFNPGTSYTSYRNWLLNATSTNMAYMLSAQLSAMALNVQTNKVAGTTIDPFTGVASGTTMIYAPGIAGVSNPFGFAKLADVMNAANNELFDAGLTVTAGGLRNYQEALKNALDRANQDLSTSFVQPAPCN